MEQRLWLLADAEAAEKCIEHRFGAMAAGDAAECSAARSIVSAAGTGVALAPETPDFDALAALLQRARVVVANDSAPLHTASVGGTPVVQLVGPTHAVENRPFAGTPSRQIVSTLGCQGCRRGCAARCQSSVDGRPQTLKMPVTRRSRRMTSLMRPPGPSRNRP